jgi:beta-mannosidase
MSSLRRLLPVVVGLLSLVPLSAIGAQPTNTTIHDGWKFRAISDTKHAGVTDWHPARVPGVVQTDLLRNKLIPDPFYRDNEKSLQWIGLEDWEYQTEFDVSTATLQRNHVDIIFSGLDTYADVFLNHKQILTADNMFRRWRVDAKQSLHAGRNSMRIVFHSAVTSMIPKVRALPYRLPTVGQVQLVAEEGVATDPYTRKAPYNYGWDWGPRYVTAGIWQSVNLQAWDDSRIDDFHIAQPKVSKQEAQLEAEFDIIATQGGAAVVDVQYRDANGKTQQAAKQSVQLAPGMNHISLPFKIANPNLWYPNGYGAQSLYTFSANLSLGKNVEDHAERRTGLRSLELRRETDQWGKSFTFVVNGIPIFAKGANVIPFDSFPDRVTPEIHRRIMTAARDVHMNMVRHWGGGYYESDDFYDICDELGIMVWQDFMFGGAMVPGDPAFQENVRQEVTEQVKRLRDHPSISIWNGNNEVEAGWMFWGDRLSFKEAITPPQRERVWQDYLILFHDVIKSVVARDGNGIPYWPSSPSANLEAPPGGERNGDMHYWSVWHALEPIEQYTHQFPRFMSEYGFQSFPELKTVKQFAEPNDLDILSPVMQNHQKNVGGNERIRVYMLREYKEPKDFASFLYVSQVLQAEAIKVGAEHNRRQRPRTMGTLYWQLNDCWPVASWASIDYYGRWKALQYYTRRFYNDLLVSPFEEEGKVNAYVVSDKVANTSARLRVRVLDFNGKSIFEKTQPVEVSALSSSVYASFTREELLKGTDAQHAFGVFDLIVGDKVESRNVYLFDRTRNLALPNPTISSDLSPGAEGYTLKLTSTVLARNVFVSFGDVDADVSDNYFDLLPNETVTLHVTSKVGADELKRSMQFQTIVGAFPQ